MQVFAFSTITAFVQYILGSHMFLFLLYFILNVLDMLSTLVEIFTTEKEFKGREFVVGLVRKVGYWIIIAVAFGVSAVLQNLGTNFGIDLGITELLGWFVLASLIFHELRSILVSLQKAGIAIPEILVKSLNLVEKELDKTENTSFDGALHLNSVDIDEDFAKLSLDVSADDLMKRQSITLKVINEGDRRAQDSTR